MVLSANVTGNQVRGTSLDQSILVGGALKVQSYSEEKLGTDHHVSFSFVICACVHFVIQQALCAHEEQHGLPTPGSREKRVSRKWFMP